MDDIQKYIGPLQGRVGTERLRNSHKSEMICRAGFRSRLEWNALIKTRMPSKDENVHPATSFP